MVRMQIGEWIETFWVCYTVAGFYCVPYYLTAYTLGSILFGLFFIGMVYISIKELEVVQANPANESTVSSCFQSCTWFQNAVDYKCLRSFPRADISEPMCYKAAVCFLILISSLGIVSILH